ncbi:MAG: hypothetical protein ACR2MK_08510 [Solirubrobacteraceae bacterium]
MLALHLRSDAFTEEQKARNFAYYEALTVRDSSLSACTQAVIAAEVGHLELAHDYFAEAALMDSTTSSTTPATPAHRVAGGRLDRRRRRLRRHARPRRRPQLRPPPTGTTDPPGLRPVLPRTAATSRGQASPGPLLTARGTAAADHPS